MNKVYKLGPEMTEEELKQEAGKWFTMDRIKGKGHCACCGDGAFVLLPADHPSVKDSGGKRYMICINCGNYSHL